jgi:hypothetical protein
LSKYPYITKTPTQYQTPTQLSKYSYITKTPTGLKNKRWDLFTDSCIYVLFNVQVHSFGNLGSNGRIISELEGIWKEAIVVQFEAVTRNMIGESETDHENPLRNEIGNQNFTNANE